MNFADMGNQINPWFDGSGPCCDVVISSRIRLARNLAGYKFLSRCSDKDKTEILEKLREILMNLEFGEPVRFVSVNQTPKLERHFLVERYLISRHHAFGKGPRGAVIDAQECFAAMINEEDHLRIQVIKGGLQLGPCYEQINRFDDMIEAKVNYAFSTKYGYLTACPTNVGTGIRVSVMLHLPALKMTDQIKKFMQAAKDMSLAVRGLFGEGSKSIGDFYQLSNQITLGVNEQDIIRDFEKRIIPEIVEYERKAREYMLSEQPAVLDDKISRAIALLRNAHLISSQEALLLLSHLRMGINMYHQMNARTPALEQLMETIQSDTARQPITTINRLFMLTQPAHLQVNAGKELSPNDRDVLRAKIIRSALNKES